MTIRTRLEHGVTILESSGTITVSGGSAALRDAGQAALGAGSKSVVVDCTGIEMMDSSGLGELVALKRSVEAVGGRLILARLPSNVAAVLKAAGLLTHFSVYDDVTAAVRSF